MTAYTAPSARRARLAVLRAPLGVLLLAGALCMLAPAPARAVSTYIDNSAKKEASALPVLNAADQKTVADAEAYLNSVKTLQARFVQTANDGTQMTGDFMLKRPGRMRFQYDPPATDFIVADGQLIYYYDGQLKQQSNTLITHSLANFFLRKDLSMSGDITPVKVEHKDGMSYIRLVQTKDPQSGSLTLVMSEKPVTLQGWRVVDAEGSVTDVALQAQTTGIDLDPGLFHYYDPKRTQSNLNK